MNIHKKTAAQIEHQVADYLLHNDNRPSSMQAVLRRKMARYLLEAGEDKLMVTAHLMNDHPLASVEDVATFIRHYPRHLRARSKDPREREFYKQKAAAVERYDYEFATTVHAIDRDAETELLAGSFAKPYRIEKNGQPYIVRVIDGQFGMKQVEKHIDAALKVQDIDHMEHVVAVSYKDGITVAPLLPGKSFLQLRMTGDAEHVTRSQLEELYDAMKLANSRGVGFDGAGGNIFYDREQGFHALDLEEFSHWSSASAALVLQLESLILDAQRSQNIPYMKQIDRIVLDAEAILADDTDAQESLERLEATRQKELIKGGLERIREEEEFDNGWRYDEDDLDW